MAVGGKTAKVLGSLEDFTYILHSLRGQELPKTGDGTFSLSEKLPANRNHVPLFQQNHYLNLRVIASLFS